MLVCRRRERLFDERVPTALEHDRERVLSAAHGDRYQHDIDIRTGAQVIEGARDTPQARGSFGPLAMLIAEPRDFGVRDLREDGDVDLGANGPAPRTPTLMALDDIGTHRHVYVPTLIRGKDLRLSGATKVSFPRISRGIGRLLGG